MKALFVLARSTSIGKIIRQIISSWPGNQNYPGNTRFHDAKSKVRCLLSFLSSTLRTTKIERERLKSSKRQKNRFLGKQVLVLGNGPSISKLDLQRVDNFKKRGGMIAVMNDFPLSSLAKEINPNLYFVGDPEYWKEDDSITSKDLKNNIWIALSSLKDVIIFQPNNTETLIPSKETIFFDHRSVAGLLRTSNPTKPWGLPASIAMIAIANCKYLGFSQIYFAGLDSTMYSNFFVNHINELGFDSTRNYFDSEMSSLKQSVFFSKDWPVRNLADVHYAQAVFLSELKKLCHDNCINVGSDNTNDATWRGCLI
jgi:hypothetical protein